MNNNSNTIAQSSGKQEEQVKELEGEKAKITSGELTKYMIDKLNDVYVKIAQTKLDEEVAYSITYNYDIIPEGNMTYTYYFTNEYVTTVLINGYPHVSYQDMGLQSEEEAYLATQLAVYEIISRNDIDGVSNGTFSLDKIVASEDQYKDMVDRILIKAKQMADNAIENTYSNQTQTSLNKDDIDFKTEGDETIVGPFYTYIEMDEYIKRYLGSSFVNTTEIETKSFIEESIPHIIDKDGNEIDSIKTGEPFYIKFIGSEQYFTQLRVQINSKSIYTRIYSTAANKKQYATLAANNDRYMKVIAVTHPDVKVGTVKISFKDTEGNEVQGVKYRLYSELGDVLQDIDGYSKWNTYSLPVGKYYIEQYEVPDNYFLNSTRYDINITKEGESVEVEIINESLDSLL